MQNLRNNLRTGRVLVIGLVSVLVILGIALIVSLLARPEQASQVQRVNALANSTDACVDCHQRSTPGIVEQFGHSTMAAAEVTCRDCHQVTESYPGSVAHQGTFILASPTAAKCENCHVAEVAQFNQSRHGLPAIVAVSGTQGLTAEQIKMYEAVPEGLFAPDKSRNAIAALEGPKITTIACYRCHNIGLPAADGSIGQCQKCHLRHEFSLEQVRKPETCNACHIGPDHPQWEIYQESPHGIAYMTSGQNWNWDADPGTLTVNDFPAPTCATCHFSGFGPAGTTHDVGDRLTWYLFSPISERRPGWQDNKIRMQGVCLQCHNENFVGDFYVAADNATDRVNEWVKESDQVMAQIKDMGAVTVQPFDQPIDFTYFELWHHYGRTAKFGAWMQGADYSQWHGAYEILSDLAELHTHLDELQRNSSAGTGQ